MTEEMLGGYAKPTRSNDDAFDGEISVFENSWQFSDQHETKVNVTAEFLVVT